MLVIAGPGREASEKSNLLFTEAAALPFADCPCLCLPAGPTKHQSDSATATSASGNQNCAKTRFTFNDILGYDRERGLGLIRLGRPHAGRRLQDAC